jgi:glutathione synthase/RimK-type ligase-like ATP-grasp enzyme
VHLDAAPGSGYTRGVSLPDPARYAMDAAQAIGAEFADLDNGAGYLFRVSKGGKQIVIGAGGVCSYPVNSATAFTLSRDKSHTKTILKEAGLPVIPGGLFFAHRRRAGLRGPGREVEDAQSFAAKLGYPVFAKPNHGSRGNYAEIISDDTALQDYARRVAVEFESFLIEPVIRGTEHRVLIRDGSPVFHSTKFPPEIAGDGRRSFAELLEAFNATLAGTGVSPYPASILAAAGLDPRAVPAHGQRFLLHGRRNLSASGGVESVSTDVPPVLAAMSAKAVAALGLRIGAVDMFDQSRAGDLSQLVIIEVNGNPGLRTLELAGRKDLIREIWTSMLNEALR